jgi:hypothetical protein
LDFLGACLFGFENPCQQGLESFGFPWILSSESSLFNGLHGKTDENFFAPLPLAFAAREREAAVEAMLKGRFDHGPSLT